MIRLSFAGSFQRLKELPNSSDEVCFVGRSNVGKSTVINALCSERVAITSKTPGRTVGLNFFKVEKTSAFIVDAPGYGFAKANSRLLERWHVLLPEYLRSRPQLRKVYLIIDSKIGFTKIDIEALAMLRSFEAPLFFIFNKTDKAQKDRLQALMNFVNTSAKEEFVFLSAKKPSKDIFDGLRANVAEALGLSCYKA